MEGLQEEGEIAKLIRSEITDFRLRLLNEGAECAEMPRFLQDILGDGTLVSFKEKGAIKERSVVFTWRTRFAIGATGTKGGGFIDLKFPDGLILSGITSKR